MLNASEKQVATIFFSNIAGYSKQVEENEATALEWLSNYKDTIEEQVPFFNGRIMNFYGDGCVAVFYNSKDAISCSKLLQGHFNGQYKIPVRIGLDRGPVVFKEGNVFGEFVNRSSRIEHICRPGGVLFSNSVYEEIKNEADFKCQSIGKYQFKNIKNRVEVFGLNATGFPLPDRNKILRSSKVIQRNKGLENRKNVAIGLSLITLMILSFFFFKEAPQKDNVEVFKSIAVLPFININQSIENVHFGDGMTDAILDHLARVKELRVTSRTSTDRFRKLNRKPGEIAKKLKVKYILEGSIEQEHGNIKINAKLLELPSKKALWAKKYDKPLTLENILNVQKEVSTSIVDELQVKLIPEVKAQIDKKPTLNLEAYEYYLKGKELVKQFHATNDIKFVFEAEKEFKRSIELDGKFADAYIYLAGAYWHNRFISSYLKRNFLDSSMVLIDQALAINPYLPMGYFMKGNYHFEQSQFALAEHNYRKTLELEPNNSNALTNLALLSYLVNDDYIESVELFNRAIALNREDNIVEAHEKFAMLYMDLGLYKEASVHFKKANELDPSSIGVVWAYQTEGKIDEVHEFLKNYIDSFPERTDILPDLAMSYGGKGEHEKCRELWDQFIADLDTKGEDHYLNKQRNKYGYLLIENGEKEAGMRQIEKCQEYLKRTVQLNRAMASGGSIQYDLAGIYSFLEDKEKAYFWLKEFDQFGWKWSSAFFIKKDPFFKNLLEDEEFNAMVDSAVANKERIIANLIDNGLLEKQEE